MSSETEKQKNLAQDNINLVYRYLDATNRWDFSTIRELLHPDVLFELPFAPDAFPRKTSGIDAVMEFLEGVPGFAEAENLYDIHVEALANDSSEIIAQCKSDMQLTNGREYKNRYIIRVSIREGQIIHFSEFFDPIPLIRAIGGEVVLPPDN